MTGTSSTYIRIDTLGNSYVTEFNANAPSQESIFRENQAFIKYDEKAPALDAQVVDEEIFNEGTEPWETKNTVQLGFKKDNYSGAELTYQVARLSKHKKIYGHHRVMFNELQKILNKTQRNRKLNMQIHNMKEGPSGGFVYGTNTVHLYDTTNWSLNTVAGTLVHELIHSLVMPFTMDLSASEQRSKYPEAAAKLDKVKDSLQEARAAVIAELESKGYTEESMDALMEEGRKEGATNEQAELSNLIYAVSNVDEFLSHIFESEQFQRFLNTKKSVDGKKTLLSKVLELLSEFLKELQKSLGIKVVKENQLAVSLKRGFEFISELATIGEELHEDAPRIVKALSKTYFEGKHPVSGSPLAFKVTTEAHAWDIADQIKEEWPFLEVGVSPQDDGTFTVEMTRAEFYKIQAGPKQKVSDKNPLDRVFGKVQEQIRSIESSIAKNKANPDILRQRQLLKELRVLNNDIKATQDLDSIKELAEFQLKWAEKVRNQFVTGDRPTSINQIMTAYRLIGVWTDLLDLMYNGIADADMEYDEDFSNIQGRAQNLQRQFNSQIMRQVFKRLAQSDIKDADFENITDTHTAVATFLSIDRAKDKVTQEVALTIQNTHRAYLEKGQQVVNELREFEKEMQTVARARGQKMEDFYQQFFQGGNNWGLVTRYTPDFYKWKSNLRRRLTDTINNIEETEANDTVRRTRIKDAYKAFWKAIDRKAGYVDVRLYLDDDGTELNNEKSAKYKKALVDEYGAEFAEEIMKDAAEKYRRYIEDKEVIEEMYDTQVDNGLMDESEAEEAKAQWDIDNSPISKIASRVNPSGTYTNFSEKYLVMVPHKDATGYDGKSLFDPQYEKIKNDKDLSKIYKKIEAKIEEYTGNLPFYLESKFHDNFLPAIRQRFITDLSSAVDYVKGIPQAMVDQITASSYEEFMQNRTSKEIPILYTDNPFEGLEKPKKGASKEEIAEYNKKKQARISGLSHNLPRILELFGLMSYHYKYFSDARDSIDLGEEILKKTNHDMQNNLRQVEKNGRLITVQASLKNTLGALEYTKDVLMFKRARTLEGKTGEIVRKKDKTEKASLRELNAEMKQLDKEFDNNEITPEEYKRRSDVLAQRMKAFDRKNVYASKVGDTIITWTQLKALSYNPMSAINNLVFGLISTTIHANGGQDYSWKDFRKAFALMMNATGRSLGLNRLTGNDSSMNHVAEKILNIMDRMGIMGDLVDSEYGESNIKAKKKGIRSVVAPYQMLRTGDYFVKALNMVAVLHHDKIMVNGEEKTLWSLLDKEGNFTIKDEQWQAEDPAKHTKWNQLRNRVIAVNKINMGNQDKSSPIWAKKWILTRLAGQFRLSWFSEGIANRFEGKSFDIQLGRERKGRYRTYADLGFFQSISVLGKQMLSAVPFVKLNPFAKAKLKNGDEMSPTDIANMRRNLAELSWFLLMFGASQMIKALATDEDDEKQKMWFKFWANMATRSYQDISVYASPSTFDQILGTPAPSLGTVNDAIKFFTASFKLMTDDDYTSEQWFYRLTKAGFIPQTALINRFKTMTEKDLSSLSR